MAALIKTDSNGNMSWMRNYPGNTPTSKVVVSDYGYILCSGLNLVKTDSEGQMLWNRSLNLDATSAVAQAHSVIQTLDGGYAVAGVGSPLNSMGQPIGDGQISYAWIIKTNSEGVIDELPSWASILFLFATFTAAMAIYKQKQNKAAHTLSSQANSLHIKAFLLYNKAKIRREDNLAS